MKIQNGISLTPPSAEAQATKRDEQLRDAAKMYETHFLNSMVKAMRSTVGQEDGLIKKNMAEKIFEQQLDNKYVDGWADQGGIGLADIIYTQIKEKIGQTEKAQKFGVPHGALPIGPKMEPLTPPATDSIKMKTIPVGPEAKLEYRFEISDPSGAAFEAQAPLPGKVVERRPLADGWNMVRMDHGLGLQSELTFPGHLAENDSQTEVQAGQKLGSLDLKRPVLAWKLDWT